MNTPLHEEARSYGIDPLTNPNWQQDTINTRNVRQAKHAPQQVDVDSGNAEVAATEGSEGTNTKSVIQSPPQPKGRPRRKR